MKKTNVKKRLHNLYWSDEKSEVRYDKLSNVDLDTQRRGGIIPYINIDKDIYFIFGVDKKYNEYSDFGGGLKNNEESIEGTLREFDEESLGIFGEFKSNDIKESYVIYNISMFTIFIDLKINNNNKYSKIEEIITKFDEKNKNVGNEMSKLVCIKKEKLIEYISDDKNKLIWCKIKNLLSESKNLFRDII